MSLPSDSLHCLQILVSAGVNTNLKNSKNQTAAEIAHDNDFKLILGYLALAETCSRLEEQIAFYTRRNVVTKGVQTEPEPKPVPAINHGVPLKPTPICPITSESDEEQEICIICTGF